MKTKLTKAMFCALSVLASKPVATFADLSAVGGSGSSLSNLVNHKLAKRVDKGSEKLWSITGAGRKASQTGFYIKVDATAAPQPAAKAPAAKTKPLAKKAPKRKLAGV